MLRTMLYMMFLTLFFIGCSTMRTAVDYDTQYDMTKLHTYTILHQYGDSLTDERIERAIAETLDAKGYKNSNDIDKSDFVVMYWYGKKEKSEVRTTFIPMGRMGFYGYAGYYETDTYNYIEGNFEIRMMDPRTKKTIWVAYGKNELQAHDTPQEREAYVKEIVDTLLQEFPSKMR